VIITELWREALGRYDDLVESGVDMVVAEVNVRYLGSAAFDDVIDFEARLTRLGETAISTRIDAAVGGSPVIAGRMRHVFIDAATKTKRPMPAHVKEALAPYVHEEDGG
jgi:acyl-CoA thioester hydrolase